MATFNTLPDNIKSIIYGYDNTYRDKYDNVIREFNKLKKYAAHNYYEVKKSTTGDIIVHCSDFNIVRRIKRKNSKYLSKRLYKMTQENTMYWVKGSL